MKRKIFISLFAAVALVGGLLYSCSKEVAEPEQELMLKAAKTYTAQSIMVNIQTSDFIISGNEVWVFDVQEASEYFDTPGNSGAAQEKCTFWDGGLLTTDETVEARTAWHLQNSTGGSADVSANILIAGESANTFKKGYKYSFTLLDSYNLSRVINVTIELKDGIGNVIGTESYPFLPVGNTLLDGTDANTLVYNANCGPYGSSSVVPLLNGQTIASILSGDAHPSNNSEYAVALHTTDTYSLAAGTYTLTVSGTIKGNDGVASQSFSNTGSFTIHAENCQH